MGWLSGGANLAAWNAVAAKAAAICGWGSGCTGKCDTEIGKGVEE